MILARRDRCETVLQLSPDLGFDLQGTEGVIEDAEVAEVITLSPADDRVATRNDCEDRL